MELVHTLFKLVLLSETSQLRMSSSESSSQLLQGKECLLNFGLGFEERHG